MKLASKEKLSSVMSEVDYKEVWVAYSENLIDDIRIPIMDSSESSKSSDSSEELLEDKPKLKTRNCFSLKHDSSDLIIENCLNENNFICYEKYFGNKFHKSSTPGRAFNTILIVTTFILLQFV